MESRIGNLPGEFEDIELLCPNCGSDRVVIEANGDGFFRIVHCNKCGYKRD